MSNYPWSAIPAARSSAPVLKIKLYVVVGVLLFAAAMGPLALIISLSGSSTPTSAPVAGFTDASGFASAIANDYLAARTTSLPVATGLDPNFAVPRPQGDQPPVKGLAVRTVVPIGVHNGTLSGRNFEIYRFAVTVAPDRGPATDISGESNERPDALYELAVTLVFNNRGLPVLAATPSLSPWPQATGATNPLDYTDEPNQQEASALVAQRVEEWARAWAKNDGAALKSLTGDKNPNSRYMGLGNFTVSGTPKIISATEAADGTLDLRVSVVLARDGAQGFAAGNEYDLLIGDPTTGNPTVLAWGPPGSAIDLVPFGNALNRRTATSNQETQP